MSDGIYCETHGETQKTYVCSHLADVKTAALGFNCGEPDDETPFPDAWCNDCEVIRAAHDGWTDEAQKLISIRLLCSGCYEHVRIRNTRTDVTLDDLADLRWKCHTCEEWHRGPCFDFSYDAPIHWNRKRVKQATLSAEKLPKWFLDEDLCIINGEHFFVRGIIELPIIGTAEKFRWGVWGSLSETNFKKLVAAYDNAERVELEPMFSWLSNQIDEYEDTLHLKMYAHLGDLDERPTFELEPTEHSLSREYYHGISAERVKDIMSRRLNEVH